MKISLLIITWECTLNGRPSLGHLEYVKVDLPNLVSIGGVIQKCA